MNKGNSLVKWLLLVASLATPLLWFNAFPLAPPFDCNDILFEGTYLVAALVAYLIVRRLQNTVLEIGFAALTVSLLLDLLDEFTKEPAPWSTMIPNLLEIGSMLTIALGFYVSQRRLEGELDRSQRARVSLEESEDRYKDLVEHTEALICTHDLQGRIQSVNQATVERLGQDRSVLLKSTIRDILAPEARDQFATYLEEIQKRGAARGLMKVMTGAGEVRIWEYHNTLRTEGVPAPIVRGVARDVTE